MADRAALMDRLTEAKARSKRADASAERPRRDIDWMDVAKSAATGARSGLESTLGSLGDIGGMQAALTAYGAGKLGLSPETAATVGKYTNPMSLAASTEDVSAASDKVLGRDDITRHTATSPQGQNIEAASNILSGLVGGPENMAKDVALKLAVMAPHLAPSLKLAVLHGVPNLFKRAALEDAAKGVNPDKIWHDWGWEKNARGDWWTESTGKPTMNENVERRPHVGGPLPPRTSDFVPVEGDPLQRHLFNMQDIPEHPPSRVNQIQMKGPRDPDYPVKHMVRGGTVSDFVTNPTLYDQPGLEFLGQLPMNLKDEPLSKTSNATGFFHWPNVADPHGSISVRSDRPHVQKFGSPDSGMSATTPGNPNPLVTTQHELTHAAAQEFGLPQGFNPSNASAANQGAYIRQNVQGDAQAFSDAFDMRTGAYWKHSDDLYDRTGETMRLADFNKKWGEENPMLQKILDENRDANDLLGMSDPTLAYHTSMGEVSARNAGRRDTGLWPPRRLRQLRPEKTEDVPRKYQWTTDQTTGDVVNPAPAASVEDPLWSPFSKTKLRRPLDEVNPTYSDTDKLLPFKPINPETLQGSTLTPAVGDRTIAGKALTGMGGKKFETPVPLQGGPNFMRGPQQQAEGAVWASDKAKASGLANRLRKLGAEGDVHLVYSPMGPHSGDYSDMTTKALMQQMADAKVSKAAKRAFDDEMRAKVPGWPGLDKVGDEWIAGAGAGRGAFAKVMALGKHQKAGFPDVGETRFSVTEPALRDQPSGSAGMTVAKMGDAPKMITDPQVPHTTYNTQVGPGTYAGGFEAPIPRSVMFPDWMRTREPGEASPLNDYAFERQTVTQKADQRWLDGLMQYLERAKR